METPADHLPGTHLLVDLYGAAHLTDAAALERILCDAAGAAGATIIATHFRVFPGAAGVTGMVLLAESHISIHTWPELGFAAVDIFMCGAADADAARMALEAAMAPTRAEVVAVARGQARDQRNQ
ncbi:adenosylmethionine decarboxylase [Fertoebacter nigrum]|uniref:Adenosylmethionine decarboxylase n=2 Tax=Fertoeibacter niger TaxID=2656921 RepID=A0A8X8KPV7_9RHOB|nr:adenosylmethionine decarboxylase [Fertoeibacter niger]NUB45291.1 adenosylmethionine decarboxylase [Fertoeibacter niger]